MLDFERVWNKICNDYVEDYNNISYHIAEKGHGFSNKPKTLYIEISAEDYDDNIIDQPFTAIRD